MKNVLVHIGYHKTATTWLQFELFIDDNAVFQPLSINPKGPSDLASRFSRDQEGYFLSPFDLNTELIKAGIEEIKARPGFDDKKIPVLSHELLSGSPHSGGFDAKSRAERIKNIFPEAKILIVVREQKSFVFSSYFEYLTQGGKLSLNEYLNKKVLIGKPYFSHTHIKYLPLIKEYRKLFGPENVLVLPYEMFRDTPLEFIERLGNFVGRQINTVKEQFHRKVNTKEDHFVNYKLRALYFYLRHSENNSFLGKLKKFMIRRILSLAKIIIPRKLDDHLQARFKKEIKTWCKDRYTETNKELGSLIGIDLAKYGY
jgi:hypothetical protein